ncbi:MAG: hypothetical protein R3B47_05055 [Bacteroidia bacterium]
MSITPDSLQVRSGEALTLTVRTPADRGLIQGIRVVKDPPLDEEGNPVFAGAYLTQIPISNELDEAGLGGMFTKKISTLFYEPGVYSFYTFELNGGELLWCNVEVLAPDPVIRTNISGDFTTGSTRWRLYDATGNPVQASPATGLPTLETGKVYYWGLNLNGLTGVSKQINADFYSEIGRDAAFPEYADHLHLFTAKHTPGYRF